MREVFAENLGALMKKHKHTQTSFLPKTGLSQSSIGRFLKKEVSITIDNIQQIAEFYGLQPWQLLVPEMDTSNPPVIKELSEKEKQFYESIRQAAREIAKHD